MTTSDSLRISLVSLQVGLPASLQIPDPDRPEAPPWTSGFIKQPVSGPVWLGTLNLRGDGQADLQHHGGSHKAVCAYSASHYPFWRSDLHFSELPWGAFGENFTLQDVTEADVCIGDVFEVGQALVEISQPRQPCWKLARRWQVKDLAARVQQTGRTGWYFRVRQEGHVEAGCSLRLLERPWPEWTVARANHLMHHDKANLEHAALLAGLPPLSPSWRETLLKRVEKSLAPDERLRLRGPDD